MSDLVPVPMRVRRVVTGDEILSERDGSRWRVTSAGEDLWRCAGRTLTVESGGRSVTSELDPDDVLQVLVPVTERDAVELCRELLGARLTGRRSIEQRPADQQTI
jgi:hypothetical protein